ncbi:hypothetical protein, partial [Effusibacillus lacus]
HRIQRINRGSLHDSVFKERLDPQDVGRSTFRQEILSVATRAIISRTMFRFNPLNKTNTNKNRILTASTAVIVRYAFCFSKFAWIKRMDSSSIRNNNPMRNPAV